MDKIPSIPYGKHIFVNNSWYFCVKNFNFYMHLRAAH